MGLLPPPTLLFFEDQHATFYTRGGVFDTISSLEDPALRWDQLFAMGMVIHPQAAAVVTPTLLRTADDGSLAGEAEGEAAVYVGWARRRGRGESEQGGVILTYGLNDGGAARWRDRHELTHGGPLTPHLTATVTGRWPAADTDGPGRQRVAMKPAELVYAMSRSGLCLGVAPEWYERYGLDEPIAPHLVRAEDRRRARRAWQAPHPTTGAAS